MADAQPRDTLPPLRDVIAALRLSAKKALGQNFLLDLNLTRRIARVPGDLDTSTVIEVGPGPGGLTRALLMEGAAHVIAIERDTRVLPALDAIAAAYPGRLTVIEDDALAIDIPALAAAAKARGEIVRIVANLPYNIGTPLLVGWLSCEPWPPWWASLTLMFQREVAERIVAPVGTPAYGRLAVLAQWRAEPAIAFDVSPKAFVPPPKVTSSVVHIVPKAAPENIDARDLAAVTAAAFGQRRKMLRAALKSLPVATDAVLAQAGIDPTARAETVDIAGFCRLATAFRRLREAG